MGAKPGWRTIELETPHLAVRGNITNSFRGDLEWQAHLEMLLYTQS
jgi:hypothetical protein